MIRRLMVSVLALVSGGSAWAPQDTAAIAEVASGKRTVAYANWWGFDDGDSTQALQAAIDSGAKTVIVPFERAPWTIRPIRLRGDLELIFEPGVLVLAKRGEFKGKGDSLFTATGANNLTIRGYGATLRMRKKDYQGPAYDKAEWRMGVAIRGCRNVLIEGLRVESSGGDGFYVDGGGSLTYSEGITIRNCVAHDNHRQGISVISAVNLLVENCAFSNTAGTAPEAGIDFEPDTPDQRLVNCVVRNCQFVQNHGHAMLVHLRPLTRASQPVSIRFENCHASMGGWAGMSVGAVGDDGPKGLIEFVNCTSENTGREGAKVYDKSASGVRVRFVRCAWKNSWTANPPDYHGPRASVLLELRRSSITRQPGGVDFEECRLFDSDDRLPVAYESGKEDIPLRDIHGTIRAGGAGQARIIDLQSELKRRLVD